LTNSFNNKKILITGGAGFIGSELVHQVAQAGAEVTVLDSLVNGKRGNFDDLDNRQVTLVEGDVRDVDMVRKLTSDKQFVFHLAAMGVRHSLHAPTENASVNGTGTLNVITACMESQIERYVGVSTSEVYGDALQVPMNEQHPTVPNTVYAAAKLAGEHYASALHISHGFPAVVIRPFNAYGPRSHHNGDAGEVIPKFMLRAMAGKPLLVFGDGSQTRDLNFVSDTARGIASAALAPDVEGEVINIGSGREISITDLALKISELVGARDSDIEYLEARPGDTQRLICDSSKARALLGYQASITFNTGLGLLFDWYQHHELSVDQLLEDDIERNWISSADSESL
jgi:UDP-glucose 4-epimerase